MTSLILASTSPYRKQQLLNLGLHFEAIAPLVDEEQLKTRWVEPQAMALGLAQAKAESLQYPEALIIGADQLIHQDGKILGKGLTKEKTLEQLQFMNGKRHELLTALFMTYKSQSFKFLDIARIQMRKLQTEELKAYIELDQPLDCAGSYKFEKAGLLLVEAIELSDPSALIGLPLMALHQGFLKLTGKSLLQS